MVRNLYKNSWFRVFAVIAVVAITVTVARTDEATRLRGESKKQDTLEPPPDDSALSSLAIEVPEVQDAVRVAQSDPAPTVQMKPGFWIGLRCTKASDVLRDQLGISKQRGLVVVEVVSGSPADKAELRRHDVLLKLGKTDLSTADDLAKAIKLAKGHETVLELIRRTKTIRAAVTPIPRPRKYSLRSNERLAKIDDERRKELITRFLGGQNPENGGRNFRIRWYGPGVIVPGAGRSHAFQGNLNIEITRANDGKVKVALSKDGKVLKTVEGDLRKLPAEFHEALRRSLGWEHDDAIGFDFKIDGATFGADCRGFIIHSRSGNALLIPLGDKSGASGGWFGVGIPPAGDGEIRGRASFARQMAAIHDKIHRIVDSLGSKRKKIKK